MSIFRFLSVFNTQFLSYSLRTDLAHVVIIQSKYRYCCDRFATLSTPTEAEKHSAFNLGLTTPNLR